MRPFVNVAIFSGIVSFNSCKTCRAIPSPMRISDGGTGQTCHTHLTEERLRIRETRKTYEELCLLRRGTIANLSAIPAHAPFRLQPNERHFFFFKRGPKGRPGWLLRVFIRPVHTHSQQLFTGTPASQPHRTHAAPLAG